MSKQGQNAIATMIKDRIIVAIEKAEIEGTAMPWQRPWKMDPDSCGFGATPRNFKTGRAYRGINVILLGIQGYTFPFWGTYKQWSEIGAQVKKGSKSTPIVFYKPFVKEVTRINKEGQEETQKRTFFTLQYFNVFNIDQVDLTDAKLPKKVEQFMNAEPKTEEVPVNEVAETVWAAYKDRPEYKEFGDRAYYSPSFDSITVPPRSEFNSLEEFYSTLFHEGVHSTGHKSRQARQSLMENRGFGSDPYCEEELIAEFGASFLMGYCGIHERTVENSAAYIKSWKDRLHADPRMVLRAAAAGQRASEYILGDLIKAENENEPINDSEEE